MIKTDRQKAYKKLKQAMKTNLSVSADYEKKDFYCLVNPYMDDSGALTFMSLGSARSIMRFGNNTCKKVTLNLTKQGNKFYYNYEIDGNKYPKTGTEEFKPSEAGKIILEINARDRVGLNDKSMIQLNINNNTDSQCIVWVYKDDKSSSRIKLGSLKNNVKVLK